MNANPYLPKPHAREAARLAALRRLNVLDTAAEPRFDRITGLVSKVLDVETVLVSLVDENRQWFKSICNLDATETSRDVAFCAHAINEPSDRLIIPDATKDPRFAANPLVTGAPKIRAYAGVVIRSEDGLPLGTLCTIAYEPRDFSDWFIESLSEFAEMVTYELRRLSWGLDKEPTAAANADQFTDQPDLQPQQAKTELSFDVLMDMRAFLSVVAITVKLPRVEALTRAYGDSIVEELITELERRIQLALKSHPHHVESRARGEFSVFAGIDKDNEAKALRHLEVLFTENLGVRIQSKSVTVATPIRIGFSRAAKASCNTKDLLRCSVIAYENVRGDHVGPAFRTYDTEMGELAGRYQKISETIVEALKANKLELHYQPKVSVADNGVVGLEALVRWNHPDLGYVAPPEILQVLEDKELVSKLDYWVLGKVCDQIREWSAQGRELLPVSVNICGATLLTGDFPEAARQIVSFRNVAIELIELEILESTTIEESSPAWEQINKCRSLGFSIALDDFGAGQTSLSYLARLPVDTVKIDRRFVANIVHDSMDSNLINRIIAMCKSLGKTTIVEGVETVGQYLLLRSFGCDQIQGYYFARPEPASEACKVLCSEGRILQPKNLEGL